MINARNRKFRKKMIFKEPSPLPLSHPPPQTDCYGGRVGWERGFVLGLAYYRHDVPLELWD
jgi:hypothetical protein